MYTFFHHKNDGWKMAGTKNKATVALYNPPHPYQTHCIKRLKLTWKKNSNVVALKEGPAEQCKIV